MNPHEAKFILQAYRPNAEHASDPEFTDALVETKKDPEFAAWFKDEMHFDSAARAALQKVSVPADLRESILVGKRVGQPVPWWQHSRWLGLAAAIVVIGGVAGLWLNPTRGGNFAEYVNDMRVTAATQVNHLDVKTSDASRIQDWLAAHSAETNYSLPAGLQNVPAMGCRVVSWHGHRVSMLCYLLDGSQHADLFIADKSLFRGAAFSERPEIRKDSDLTTVVWSRNDKVYVLIGAGDGTALRKYVAVRNEIARNGAV